MIVGKIQQVDAHPMADKLKLCQVQLNETDCVQIVCGAPNVAPDQHVPVATVGTRLEGPEDKVIKIKRSKLRGEVSFGMICSAGELGLEPREDDTGILVLQPTKIGQSFDEYMINSTS